MVCEEGGVGRVEERVRLNTEERWQKQEGRVGEGKEE